MQRQIIVPEYYKKDFHDATNYLLHQMADKGMLRIENEYESGGALVFELEFEDEKLAEVFKVYGECDVFMFSDLEDK